jgi:hypothetical protein
VTTGFLVRKKVCGKMQKGFSESKETIHKSKLNKNIIKLK